MSQHRRAAPDDLLPLAPAVFHILLCLGEGDRHGYAIKRDIHRRTQGRLSLGPAMLYGSIRKMLEQGLIQESDERPDPHLDDQRRRYYRVTPFGREVARAEAGRLRSSSRICARRS